MTSPRIGFPALERAVSAALEIPTPMLPKLRARIRHLQRFGFPPGSEVGRNGRAQYSLEDVCAVTIAFAFIDAYLSPSVAVALTSTWWPELARPMLAAAVGGRGVGPVIADLPAPPCTDTIIVLRPQALTLLGAPLSLLLDDERDPIMPSTADASSLADLFSSGDAGRRAAITALDAADLMVPVLASLAAEPGVDGAWLRREIGLMWRGGGWSGRGHPAEPLGHAGDDTRIGGKDRFFARTVQLLSSVRARLGHPIELDARERRLVSYLRSPTPIEAWKRGYRAPGLAREPLSKSRGDLAFLATLSAVLSQAGVPRDCLPLRLSRRFLAEALPPGTDGADPAVALDAVFLMVEDADTRARSAAKATTGEISCRVAGSVPRPADRS